MSWSWAFLLVGSVLLDSVGFAACFDFFGCFDFFIRIDIFFGSPLRRLALSLARHFLSPSSMARRGVGYQASPRSAAIGTKHLREVLHLQE